MKLLLCFALPVCWLLSRGSGLALEPRPPAGDACNGSGDGAAEAPRRRGRFTIEELLTTKFPSLITGDLDADVCKAGQYAFLS